MATRWDKSVARDREDIGYKATQSKLTPTAAGLTGGGTTHQCSECLFFIKDGDFSGRCFFVRGPVAAYGTCNAFDEGTPKSGRDYPYDSPDYNPPLDRAELGYRERADGFFCRNCVFWLPDGENPGCVKVAGKIEGDMCCNHYEDYRS